MPNRPELETNVSQIRAIYRYVAPIPLPEGIESFLGAFWEEYGLYPPLHYSAANRLKETKKDRFLGREGAYRLRGPQGAHERLLSPVGSWLPVFINVQPLSFLPSRGNDRQGQALLKKPDIYDEWRPSEGPPHQRDPEGGLPGQEVDDVIPSI